MRLKKLNIILKCKYTKTDSLSLRNKSFSFPNKLEKLIFLFPNKFKAFLLNTLKPRSAAFKQ